MGKDEKFVQLMIERYPYWISGLLLLLGLLINMTRAIPCLSNTETDLFVRMAEAIILSLLTGVILHRILIFGPQQSAKTQLSKYIMARSRNVAGDAEAILSELIKSTKLDPEIVTLETVTFSQINEICENITLHGEAPIIVDPNTMTRGNWLDFFIFRKNRTHEFIERLFRVVIYLEPDHIDLLIQIDENTFFMCIENARSLRNYSNQSLELPSKELYKYLILARDLKKLTIS